MKTFSALLTLCEGNSSATGEFPPQRRVTPSFDVFFDLRLDKRFNKQSKRQWFATPSRPLWLHCNVSLGLYHQFLTGSCHIFSQWRSLHWHRGNLTIIPVSVKDPWRLCLRLNVLTISYHASVKEECMITGTWWFLTYDQDDTAVQICPAVRRRFYHRSLIHQTMSLQSTVMTLGICAVSNTVCCQCYNTMLMTWWRHQMVTFSALLAINAGNSLVTGEFPAQRPATQNFDGFFFICVWLKGLVNNREAGDLRRHRTHYDVTVVPRIEFEGISWHQRTSAV